MLLKVLISTLTEEDFRRIGELREDEMTKLEGISAEQIAKAYKKFCKMLSGLTAEPSDVILLAMPVYEDGERSVDAAYYQKEELLGKLSEISKMETIAYSDADSSDRLSEILQETGEHMPMTYGFEFTPWEEVLGAEVYPENYEYIGRAEFVSAVLGEMTFNGFDRESQEERREKMEKACAEAEEIAKLPPEERKTRYFSMDDIFTEFGIEKDEKWEADKRLSLLDCVRTREERVRELKRMASVIL